MERDQDKLLSHQQQHTSPALSDRSQRYGSTASSRSDSNSFAPPPPPPPRKPRRSILLSVCSFILVTEFCERLAYYGLVSTLPVLFTTKFKLSNLLTTELNSLFSSISYLTPILGAVVADIWLGRFRTIALFCAIYLVGLAMCVLAVFPGFHHLNWLFFVGLFVFVSLGAGGIKPNVVVLGADQFYDSARNPGMHEQKASFFRWFYWAVNLGASFSYLYLSNLALNGQGKITVEYGYFACYSIIFASFAIAFVTFLAGFSRYRVLPPSGSAVVKSMKLLWFTGQRSNQGKIVLMGCLMFIPAVAILICSYFVGSDYTTPVSAFGMGLVLLGGVLLVKYSQNTRWLVYARESIGGNFSETEVNDIGQVVRLLPYCIFMILFWAVYGQMPTNFVVQGCQMDTRLSTSSNYQLNATVVNAFDSLAILILVPVLEHVILPCLAARGVHPTTLQKIGAGFIFSLLSMVTAAVVETERKKASLLVYSYDTMPTHDRNSATCNPLHLHNSSMIACTSAMKDDDCHCIEVDGISYLAGCTGEPMAAMSVFWQIIQYALIGISEILASTSAYELFYNQVPETMRSVCQSLNLLTTSVGTMVTGGLNAMFAFWMHDNLNKAKLEYLFIVLAAAMATNFVCFCVIARGFVYVKHQSRVVKFPSTLSENPPQHEGQQRSSVNARPVFIPRPTSEPQNIVVSPSFLQDATELPNSFVTGFSPPVAVDPAHQTPPSLKT